MKKFTAIIFSCLFLISYSLHSFAGVAPVSPDQDKAQASQGDKAQKNQRAEKNRHQEE